MSWLSHVEKIMQRVHGAIPLRFQNRPPFAGAA